MLFLCVHGESLVSCLLLSIFICLVKARSLSLYNCNYYIYLNTLFFFAKFRKKFLKEKYSLHIFFM